MIAQDFELYTLLLILLLIVSVAAGLWVGNNLGHQSRRALKNKKGGSKAPEASLGKHAQDLVTGAAVKLWRWRRERSRERKE
ncbi:MAG: hypothetical protein R3B09_05560 [Nannocystaceae bacterium]